MPASGAAAGWAARRRGGRWATRAVTLAVVASVRHEDTEYDSLLMSGVPREAARDRVRPDIDRVLNGWALPWLHGVAPSPPARGLVR